MSTRRFALLAPLVLLHAIAGGGLAQDAARPPAARPSPAYAHAAAEVMRHIEVAYGLPGTHLYAHSLADRRPDFTWGNGVMFTALLGAARHEPTAGGPAVARFFAAIDRYWDRRAPIPGYEPLPTAGDGHDKYYDDNAWLAIACVEAFELTDDRAYLDRAIATQRFVLSGWDAARGGGIWWHEGHKDGTKNTCANAPAAVACLRLAAHLPAPQAAEMLDEAERIVAWTSDTLELPDGLYADNVNVATGTLNRDRLTYNTALMTRAFLGLWRATGDDAWRRRAVRASDASDWFLDARTHAYRDAAKWSHLLVEADCEVYRATGDRRALRRATDTADVAYAAWQRSPPAELIDHASIARMLWVVAEATRPATRK